MKADGTAENLSVLKFVIDSNIWINALCSCGNAKWRDRELARSCIKKASGNGIIIADDRTMYDLERKMKAFVRDAYLFQREADNILREVRAVAQLVETEKGYIRKNIEELRKCRDGDDWPFLIISDAHKAFAIVSSDNHLLRLQYRDVKILSPQQFILEHLRRGI